MSNLTADEQGWLQAVESAAFGVWDLDPRLEMVHYSPQWKARLGFPQIESPDSTGFWRSRVHPDDFGGMLGALRSHLDGFTPSYDMQFRLRINGSGYRTVLSRGRVVERDHRGNATRMVGTMVDLTGRPAIAQSHGLATELAATPMTMAYAPLHLLLAGAGRGDAGELVDSIADLLDTALKDSGLTPRR
ncbi:MAG: PAS domain-containing protein [Rhizobacter sp.]|nr:PAS domain-containing protein [Rhizobacter sp.]